MADMKKEQELRERLEPHAVSLLARKHAEADGEGRVARYRTRRTLSSFR